MSKTIPTISISTIHSGILPSTYLSPKRRRPRRSQTLAPHQRPRALPPDLIVLLLQLNQLLLEPRIQASSLSLVSLPHLIIRLDVPYPLPDVILLLQQAIPQPSDQLKSFCNLAIVRFERAFDCLWGRIVEGEDTRVGRVEGESKSVGVPRGRGGRIEGVFHAGLSESAQSRSDHASRGVKRGQIVLVAAFEAGLTGNVM